MSVQDDIKKVAEQERALVFDRFDEVAAFEIGSALRARALKDKLPIVADIRTWDRQLFYCAMPGSSASNANWARRKVNAVKMFGKSTYRMVLEQGVEDQLFPARFGLDPSEYALAGGCFPIVIRNAGLIGAITVSGLQQRQDHELVVSVLCEYLGLDGKALALDPERSGKS